MFTRHKEENTEISPEVLFKKFYPRLCDFACYLVKDSDAAEDIVQDAFIVFLEQKENVDQSQNLWSRG